MNKSELITRIASKYPHVTTNVEDGVNLMLHMMSKKLEKRGRIEIREFGAFIVRDYSYIRNFYNRHKKTLYKSTFTPRVLFKASKAFSLRVNKAK